MGNKLKNSLRQTTNNKQHKTQNEIFLAVLASVAVAGPRGDQVDTSGLGKLGNDQRFNDHTAKYNV